MEVIFDTLKVYERLKGADLSEKAAKEIAEIFRETIEERLATKRDLTELEKHFDLRFKELDAKLELKISETKVDIIKWVAAMLVAQAALISALVKLL
jgi:hypothetical protein